MGLSFFNETLLTSSKLEFKVNYRMMLYTRILNIIVGFFYVFFKQSAYIMPVKYDLKAFGLFLNL